MAVELLELSAVGYSRSVTVLSSALLDVNALVFFQRSRKNEGIGRGGRPCSTAGDQVRAADPVRLREVGWRPLRRMIGMRVVEADDLQSALASVALGANQLARIDMVLGALGIEWPRSGSGRCLHNASVAIECADQDAAAFLRISFFAVAANILKVSCGDFSMKRLWPELRADH